MDIQVEISSRQLQMGLKFRVKWGLDIYVHLGVINHLQVVLEVMELEKLFFKKMSGTLHN